MKTTPEPLAIIVSVNINSGQVLHEFVEWSVVEMFLEDYKRDFPDYFHFFKLNKSARKTIAKEHFNFDI